jgi:hypothetical protein
MKSQTNFFRPAALVALLGASVLFIMGCGGPTNPTTFSLGSGRKRDFSIEFKAGQKVDIWVTSEQDSDVDMFVHDAGGVQIASDIGDSKNCHVSFTPGTTQTFRIEVQNRVRLEGNLKHRNRENTCTLKWSPEK